MSEIQCLKVEKMLYHFLWGDKRAKIATKTLQLPKDEGGLHLFDIRNKQRSLKIQWITKIKSNSFFNECFQLSFPQAKHSFFWMCNMSKKDVYRWMVTENTGKFWEEILSTWSEFNFMILKINKMYLTRFYGITPILLYKINGLHTKKQSL